ncbi:hypothetical protein L198_01036 [Cryptococcus wingfieldii CBS 7118]|uniref:Uncharacterized protein n=1 Tax=Cryptococcus wingfieldii CBS 7118 TaxID=1295528 RepID=A0A1E3K4L8_9TREE|nr:hypothetical protein L198_01036 [Cryptococcus wingfieldii CBS 7118]ODO07457.1 hypothetical protein L198_01036 [Cryptococcus wingfieldii CBS 7118]
MMEAGHGPIHPSGPIYISAQAQQPPPHGHAPHPFVHQASLPQQQHLYYPPQPARPASPEELNGVPCLQVTQPTPTKGRKYRTASDAGGSTSGESLYMASPTWRTGPMIPSPGSAGGSLDVSVEPLQHYAGPPVRASRPRSPDVEQFREGSEDGKEAKRKQRAREMGRERQRRKRERDKKAREEAMKGKSQSRDDVPSGRRTSNTSYTGSQNSLSITVPSPASAYSPLGTSSSYFSISPSGHQLGQKSGQSSPGAFFSPTVSTPSSFLESNGTSYWGEGKAGAGGLDLSANKPTRPVRPSRVSSGNVPTGATLKISSSTGLPVPPNSNSTSQPIVGPAPPTKRRKSEPKPDTFRATRENSFGRVQSLAALDWAKDDRPRLQRTSSDGAVLRRIDTKEKSRSLTPPPVPLLPEQFRHQSRLSMADTGELTGASSEGQYFASFIVHEAASSNSEDAVLMRERLGLGIEEMSSMKDNIAMAYDKWKLERGMSKISLGSDSIRPSTAPSASQSPRGSRTSLPDPNIFTPVSNMPVRYARVPNTLPMSTSYAQHQPQDSPLTSVAQGRGRSLSSLSMTAVIESAQWSVSDTPGAVPAGAMVKDDTGSPNTSSIHTPSTGQGAFPIMETNAPPKALWTDPVGGRMYHAYHNAPGVQSIQSRDEFNQKFVFGGEGQLLDSPLSMTGQVEGMRLDMPPPPPSAGGVHLPRQLSMSAPSAADRPTSSSSRHERHASASVVSTREAGHFRTPSGPRSAGLRNVQTQFTPPTPLSARGSGSIQSQQNTAPGYAADEQMDGMLFYTGVFGTAPQQSQGPQETQVKEALPQQQQQENFSFMPSQPYPSAPPVTQGSFQTSQPLATFSSQQSENQ